MHRSAPPDLFAPRWLRLLGFALAAWSFYATFLTLAAPESTPVNRQSSKLGYLRSVLFGSIERAVGVAAANLMYAAIFALAGVLLIALTLGSIYRRDPNSVR